jgi:hypothetical protein
MGMSDSLKKRALVAATVAVVLMAGCGSDQKQPEPAATATTTTTAAETPAATPTSVVAETLFGLPVKQLKLVAPAPLPDAVVLYIESGCWGCDGPVNALQRVYRGPDGIVRTDDLFRLDGASVAAGKYISSLAPTAGGNDFLMTVCEGPYCGGVGEQAPGAMVSIRHSVDGGIAWVTESTFAGGAVMLANRGLATGGTGSGLMYVLIGGAGFRLVNYPGGGTDGIELRGMASPAAAIFAPANGPPLLRDADGVRFYRLDGSPANAPAYDFSALSPQVVVQWLAFPPNGAGPVVTFELGERLVSAAVKNAASGARFTELFVWPASKPAVYGVYGVEGFIDGHTWVAAIGTGSGNVPAIIDFGAGTISPIAELLSRGEAGDRMLVRAVKTGPFARVTGAGAGDCLNVRESPALTAPSFACYADGVLLSELGQRTNADGQEWTLVGTPAGRQGWASTVFLETSGGAP